MRLRPKLVFALAVSSALVAMATAPTITCAQKGDKGGGKGRGGGLSQSRGGGFGGSVQGGKSKSWGRSNSSFRGNPMPGSSATAGVTKGSVSQPRAITNGNSRSNFSSNRSTGRIANDGRNLGATSPFTKKTDASQSGFSASTRSTGNNSSWVQGRVNDTRGANSGSRESAYRGRPAPNSAGGHNDNGMHNHGQDDYHDGHGHHGGHHSSFNQFYFGPYGFGYSYFGDGFGLSIGLPLHGYYDYYNVAQPYYVGGFVEPYPYYSEFEVPTYVPDAGIGVLEPGIETPTPVGPDAGRGLSIIPARGRAEEYQAQAEADFRTGNYQDAARSSAHALIENGDNGRLHLFASQIFFALGDYPASAAAIQRSASLLDRSEWGFVVQNFKKFYQGRDYVEQMDALVQFIRANPDQAYAHFLRGYHYKFLGHDEAARAPLTRAVELEIRDRLAAEILVMAGGQLPANSNPIGPNPAHAGKLPLNAAPPDQSAKARQDDK